MVARSGALTKRRGDSRRFSATRSLPSSPISLLLLNPTWKAVLSRSNSAIWLLTIL